MESVIDWNETECLKNMKQFEKCIECQIEHHPIRCHGQAYIVEGETDLCYKSSFYGFECGDCATGTQHKVECTVCKKSVNYKGIKRHLKSKEHISLEIQIKRAMPWCIH